MKYTNKMFPRISASKVAGFIGLHKYQNQHEIFYELLCRNKDVAAQIAEIEREEGRRPYQKVLDEVMKESSVRDCVSLGVKACETTQDVRSVLTQVESQAQAVLSLRHGGLSQELRDKIAEEISGKVGRQRGINNEATVLNNYETTQKVKVTDRNNKTIVKECINFSLVGRCDGYVESENRIVDSKERTRWWPEIPIYDEIQMRAYMFMTGAKESELVERFPDGRTRNTKYLNDADKWKTIHDLIDKNVEVLNSAMCNPEDLKRIVLANTVVTTHAD